MNNTKTKYNVVGKWSKEIFGNILSHAGLVALIVTLILIVFSIAVPLDKLDNTGIVISFIGVLATFVVIGNFAQTSRIEDQLKKGIGDVENRVKECEEKDKQLKKLTQSITTQTQQIDYLNKQIEIIQETSRPIEKKDLARFIKLFIGKERDIRKNVHLFTKLINPDSTYVVILDDGSKHQIKINYIDGGELEFIDNRMQQISAERVQKLSGMPFDKKDIIFIYQLLNEIYIPKSEIDDDLVEVRDVVAANNEDETTENTI